jgi:hypothetical protein
MPSTRTIRKVIFLDTEFYCTWLMVIQARDTVDTNPVVDGPRLLPLLKLCACQEKDSVRFGPESWSWLGIFYSFSPPSLPHSTLGFMQPLHSLLGFDSTHGLHKSAR